jgi:cephalosporin hydroxylase
MDLQPARDLTLVDRERCVAAFGQWRRETLKHRDDLRRYHYILERDQPEVIVELGRYNGESARWFAEYAPVVSVDVNPLEAGAIPGVHCVNGSSVSNETVAQVWDLVGEQRAMVVLDSDHSTRHVFQEIALYRHMVGRGCHLVIEDTILAWLPKDVLERHTCWYEGNPMDAMQLAWDGGYLDGFTRDVATEVFDGSPTMHPSGWWRA